MNFKNLCIDMRQKMNKKQTTRLNILFLMHTSLVFREINNVESIH
jgi:hypothetical protein